MIQLLVLFLAGFQADGSQSDAGLFAKSLWFLQSFGHVECSIARHDIEIKNVLAKSLANDRELTLQEIEAFVDPSVFRKFAGDDSRLSSSEITKALDEGTPQTRLRLHSELRRHCDLLSTSFDMIDPTHYAAIDTLSDWLAENWQPETSLHVLTTCTGNSRRSILGASMGNLAASYYGLDNVHFHSGGTTPSAFNKRTIATLKSIGFQIEPTGEQAMRGDPKVPNSIYRVSWGQGHETLEFSKSYKDKSNPQSGFAAILVCAEADAECPIVEGAALRISMTFIDPKLYDDGTLESSKYAERRDDIGRTLMAVMAGTRCKIQIRETRKKSAN